MALTKERVSYRNQRLFTFRVQGGDTEKCRICVGVGEIERVLQMKQ